MKKENIVQYKADELPETTKTDWKRLDAMTDDEIDTSEIPELDEEWFKNVKVVFPQKKKAISIRQGTKGANSPLIRIDKGVEARPS